MHFDVAVIGGGPGGSTLGTILRKYDPSLKVGIFEREVFPRDHVGESQLPGINAILNEMGVWDKIEAANFPVKLGATYRWGCKKELWDFRFIPHDAFVEEPRPAKFQGQRTHTAFQVDRSVYDEILLDHASEHGCEVFEETGVVEVLHEGDRVTGFRLSTGEMVTADTYVDASGHSGILRRAMGVEIDNNATLQNVAFWDYWQNAEWANEIGVGGTYIQIMSLGYGWIWFIPLGPTRTSIGLVVPAAYYKSTGKRPRELYLEAVAADERISHLMRNATSEDKFYTTKDWSFYSKRNHGENWFLVGEAAGFADPILSAGLTITHIGARELANTIHELRRGSINAEWLKDEYDKRQRQRVRSHIRFADFWYTSNGQFTDLKEFTSQIASEAGLTLDPEQGWRWIAQGGFIDEDLGFGTGTYSLGALKLQMAFLNDYSPQHTFAEHNMLHLQVDDADVETRAFYPDGRVERIECFVKNGKVLPLRWVVPTLISILRMEKRLPQILERLEAKTADMKVDEVRKFLFMSSAIQALEALVIDGWATTSYDPEVPLVELKNPYDGFCWSDEVTIGAAALESML
jgi:flavin-dependent dehydrogenase